MFRSLKRPRTTNLLSSPSIEGLSNAEIKERIEALESQLQALMRRVLQLEENTGVDAMMMLQSHRDEEARKTGKKQKSNVVEVMMTMSSILPRIAEKTKNARSIVESELRRIGMITQDYNAMQPMEHPAARVFFVWAQNPAMSGLSPQEQEYFGRMIQQSKDVPSLVVVFSDSQDTLNTLRTGRLIGANAVLPYLIEIPRDIRRGVVLVRNHAWDEFEQRMNSFLEDINDIQYPAVPQE